jgi:glucose/arabinose dehydrogenase
VHAVLDDLCAGDRHEAHAHRRVLVGPDDNLALPLGQNLPAERLRPEPGQPRQVVSVNNDVMKADRHAVSMRRHAGLAPRNPPASLLRCRDESGHNVAQAAVRRGLSGGWPQHCETQMPTGRSLPAR